MEISYLAVGLNQALVGFQIQKEEDPDDDNVEKAYKLYYDYFSEYFREKREPSLLCEKLTLAENPKEEKARDSLISQFKEYKKNSGIGFIKYIISFFLTDNSDNKVADNSDNKVTDNLDNKLKALKEIFNILESREFAETVHDLTDYNEVLALFPEIVKECEKQSKVDADLLEKAMRLMTLHEMAPVIKARKDLCDSNGEELVEPVCLSLDDTRAFSYKEVARYVNPEGSLQHPSTGETVEGIQDAYNVKAELAKVKYQVVESVSKKIEEGDIERFLNKAIELYVQESQKTNGNEKKEDLKNGYKELLENENDRRHLVCIALLILRIFKAEKLREGRHAILQHLEQMNGMCNIIADAVYGEKCIETKKDDKIRGKRFYITLLNDPRMQVVQEARKEFAERLKQNFGLFINSIVRDRINEFLAPHKVPVIEGRKLKVKLLTAPEVPDVL